MTLLERSIKNQKVKIEYLSMRLGEFFHMYDDGNILFLDHPHILQLCNRPGFKLDAQYFIESCLLNLPCTTVIRFSAPGKGVWYNHGDEVLLYILSFYGCLKECNVNGWSFEETTFMRLLKLIDMSFKTLPQTVMLMLRSFNFSVALFK